MLGGGVSGHGFLQLDPHHERCVVGARAQISHRRQCRNAAGRARGFVPSGRGVPKVVADRGRHGAEVALAGEHLAEGIPDMDHPDVGGAHLGRSECVLDDLGGQSREVAVLLGEVAGEIALVAAKDPHACRAIHTPHATPERRARSAVSDAFRSLKMADPSALGPNRRDLGGHVGRPTRPPVLVHYHSWREANITTNSAAETAKLR
jgi:hypothetical protein